jgi:putative Mg2+ transporter-C (MgtC) family protein
MLISTHFVYFQHYVKDDLVAVDTSRIAASVVTGVGFLGGGAILRTGVNVQGLTTAAGLWLVTAIGLSAGAGMYAISVASTVLGVVALTLLRRLEHKEDDVFRRRVTLVLDASAPPLVTILGLLNQKGIVIAPAEYEKQIDERLTQIAFYARVPRGASDELLTVLESQSGVKRVRVEAVT